MSESGMTLLELSKIAKNIGFSAKAYRTDFETIIGIDSPLVLNTISKSGQNGYVVMLGTTEKKGIKRFIIGDPLHGVYFLSQKQLEERWYSRICLILEVTKKLELSDLAVKPKLIINHLMSEKKLWRLMLFITLIQTLVLTIGIILALRLLDVILFPDILRLASLSQALEVFIIFIIYLFFDSFRTYISKIYSLKMLGVFQYEYHNYLLGMSKSYLSNQNKDSLTAQGLNNISQMMKYLTKVIKGIPYFFAFPIVLITLTIRSWEILLVGTPIFALLHIWYYRKRILLSHGYYASVAHVGTSIVSFFEFVENLGLYKSFKSSSTILYNSTQWLVYFNFGWAEILICQFVGIILISWLLYSHIFNKSNMNPEVNGLSFNSFALHQYYGAEYLSISKKWNVFLDYPKGFQRNKYILGWVLPQAAIVVGLQLVIIHIFLRENQTFRSNYRIILPWIYVLLVLSVFLCFYLYMRVKFTNYKRANRSDVQIL